MLFLVLGYLLIGYILVFVMSYAVCFSSDREEHCMSLAILLLWPLAIIIVILGLVIGLLYLVFNGISIVINTKGSIIKYLHPYFLSQKIKAYRLSEKLKKELLKKHREEEKSPDN